MKFRVTLKNKDGAEEVRVMEATSHFPIYKEIEKEGGTVLAIKEAGPLFHAPAWFNIRIGSGVKQQQVITMSKNLSAMLAAGLSLSRAVSVLERQAANDRLKEIARGIGDSVKEGALFHEALAKYPDVFSSLFVAMTKAGEESGSLSEALGVVGLQMEHTLALIRKVRGAMIYPAIVVSAIVIVSILMLMFVVPTLTATFTELHVKIPLSTQIIVAVSNGMAEHPLLVLLAFVAIIGGGIFGLRSKLGKKGLLAASLRAPIIGELVRETYAARAARTLSSLLSSGVPVLEALAITKDVVGEGAFGKVIEEAQVRVRKGEALSGAFADNAKLYPLLMSDMISVGEETGNLSGMLKQVAEFYESDVAERTKDLSTVIEPILMLVIGTMVGVFAVSMIAPIYSISSAI